MVISLIQYAKPLFPGMFSANPRHFRPRPDKIDLLVFCALLWRVQGFVGLARFLKDSWYTNLGAGGEGQGGFG